LPYPVFDEPNIVNHESLRKNSVLSPGKNFPAVVGAATTAKATDGFGEHPLSISRRFWVGYVREQKS
jgi:hypothetical protein